uniref:Uncharacterized protein n=1 Tax=Daphnia galeata TaxID=27404 RepID=A0A8J2WLS2_9CRUS|nr:unnamed protein product [Daphnia galeata]
MKQTLAGISENKWKDTVDYLQKLHENPNNVIKILRNEENEVSLDGTYKTTNAGFTLDHVLIHDNNGVVNPSLFFFVKEETTEAKSKCLRIFMEINDVHYGIYPLSHYVVSYFDGNWFSISDRWSYLERHHLPTFDNNTTNRLERY